MNDNASVFWENVKKYTKTKKTTLEWIAKNSGISANTFQGWILKRRFPRAHEAVRIAASLGTSVECLVRDEAYSKESALMMERMQNMRLKGEIRPSEIKMHPPDGMTIDEIRLVNTYRQLSHEGRKNAVLAITIWPKKK